MVLSAAANQQANRGRSIMRIDSAWDSAGADGAGRTGVGAGVAFWLADRITAESVGM